MPRMSGTIKGGDAERRGGERRQAPAAAREREGRSALYKEDVIRINRCAKVTAGGKRFSFSSFVVLGDSNGKVGYGIGKAKEVSSSIDKAVRNGEKNIRTYPVINGTIPHEVEGRFGASRVRLIPAAPGTGVIAGRSVRAVLEKLGIHNILTKSYGSRNPMNLVRATFDALERLRTKEQYQALRGVEL